MQKAQSKLPAKEENSAAVEAVAKMGADEYYADNHVEKKLPDSHISRRNASFYGVCGFQSLKRYNIHFLADNLIIYALGNKYQTFNLDTKATQTFHGHDEDGVGSIAVHPSREFFAVAEKGANPLIYVYSYPSMKLYRILKGGTEMSYIHCEFSSSGENLVSVGGEPDFTITVWNWRDQAVILKAKAFSAEVFRASFSPTSDNIIFTSGSGHIKFWKMAETFTGLKLQGEIAKFGKLELSDVYAFYELPDGKVISGTDQGTLILWDGVQVKAHLVLEYDEKTGEKKPLHDGAIEVILFENNEFITAGRDGFIKWWSLQAIDNAEADEVSEVCIQPLNEIAIRTPDGQTAIIYNMVRGKNFWLIQDGRGHLFKVDCEDYQQQIVMKFHCGAITDMAISDCCNMCVTCAEDGTIKLWDYVSMMPLFERKFKGRANCLDLLKRSDVNKGRVAVVGYDSGIVRVVYFTETSIELGIVQKAADAPIVKIKYAPSQNMLVTASINGEIFFFEVSGHADLHKFEPVCIVQIPDKVSVTDLKWDNTSTKVLISADNGRVYEIARPNPASINNKETYLQEDYPIRSWQMKMMEFQMKKNQKKDEEEEERKRRARLRGELKDEEQEQDEDWDPECITAVTYTNDKSGQFIVGCTGKYAGYYYRCDFNSQRPLEAIPMPKTTNINFMHFNAMNDTLITGFTNGDIRLSTMEFPKNFLSIKQHDGYGGRISSAKMSHDERFLVSAGSDGLIFIHLIDKFMIHQEARFDPAAGIDGIEFMPEAQAKQSLIDAVKKFQDENMPNIPEIDKQVEKVDESLLAITLRIPKDTPDIIDETIYSIQQAKLRTEEDHRLKMAEEKKQQVRNKVKMLRTQFKTLKEKNDGQQEVLRVTNDDFNIDPDYFEQLLVKNEEKIQETRKEVQWNIIYHKTKLDKLKEKFFDVFDYEKFMVKALKTPSYVTSFRCAKLSDLITENIKRFKELLEQEIEMKEQNEMQDMDLLDDRGDANRAKERQRAAYTHEQKKTEQHFKTAAEKERAERKVQREQRKVEIDRLTQQEHLHNGEDKEEKEKIENAKRTFGEYKLKKDKDYEVPEDQQVNHLKKKQQMILLESSIHNIKVKFNDKVHELRKRKVVIIENVDNLYTRLSEINKELGYEDETVKYYIDDEVENPAKKYTVDDKQIEEYREELKRREEDAKQQNKPGGKKTRKTVNDEKAADFSKVTDTSKKEAIVDANKEQISDLPDHMRMVAGRQETRVQDNDLYAEIREIRKIELEFEKSQIKEDIEKQVNDFDEEIHEMQKEKYRLESDLKNAEIKLILLFEELIILNSLDDRDAELTLKLQRSKQEKSHIIRGITSITRQLEEKKDKIDEIQKKENDLKRRFHELCKEDSDQYAALSAFYEKLNIRRKKPEKKREEQDGEEDDEEGEAVEEEAEEEEEEDDDQGIAGLNPEDYKIDDIENLRNERLDLWDEKTNIQEQIQKLQKDQKDMAKQETAIEAMLKETQEEIKDFQLEKLKKMNELEMCIVLEIEKIQNLGIEYDREKRFKQYCEHKEKLLQHKEQELQECQDEEQTREIEHEIEKLREPDYRGFYLPKDLHDSVLFTGPQLQNLLDRQRDLKQECFLLEKDQKRVVSDCQAKKNEMHRQNKELEAAQRDYDERRMLRFGNLVDLDSLEVSGPSQVVLDLQAKFAKVDKRCYLQKEEAESDLQKTQRELTECIQKNTYYLNGIRELGEQQQQLQKKLDGTNKAIFVDEDNEEKRKLQEKREKYKEVLRKQAEDINKIKNEINLYKRKGGHIYTKVTTNRKVASLNDN